MFLSRDMIGQLTSPTILLRIFEKKKKEKMVFITLLNFFISVENTENIFKKLNRQTFLSLFFSFFSAQSMIRVRQIATDPNGSAA